MGGKTDEMCLHLLPEGLKCQTDSFNETHAISGDLAGPSFVGKSNFIVAETL